MFGQGGIAAAGSMRQGAAVLAKPCKHPMCVQGCLELCASGGKEGLVQFSWSAAKAAGCTCTKAGR